MDSMKRRTFFRSLLGLMAIPFVGLKKPEPPFVMPFVMSESDASKLVLSPEEFYKRYIQPAMSRAFDMAADGKHMRDWYSKTEFTHADMFISESPWAREALASGELGTCQTIIIDEETNVSRSI